MNDTVYKHRCPKCGKGYQRGGGRFDSHVASCDRKPSNGVPKELATDKGESIAEELRERARQCREQADTLNKKANRLEEMAEEVGRL